jgi:hypothetical protein
VTLNYYYSDQNGEFRLNVVKPEMYKWLTNSNEYYLLSIKSTVVLDAL